MCVSLMGSTDQVRIAGWFQSAAYQVEQIRSGGDGLTLHRFEVDRLVQAMATFGAMPAGQSRWERRSSNAGQFVIAVGQA